MGLTRNALNNIVTRAQAQPRWQGAVPLTSNTILSALDIDVGNPHTTVNTPEKGMGIAAAARATAILSGAVAGAPKQVVNRTTGAVTPDSILIDNPHPMMSDFTFWELMMLHLIYQGDFFGLLSFKGPISRVTVSEITPLDPRLVTPTAVVQGHGRSTRWVETVYVADMDGERVAIPSEEMLHVPGLGFDGLRGISLLSYARRGLEATASSDEFANKFYANGSLMSGILTTDKRLDEKAAEGLKQRWRKKVQGIDNAFDIVVLDSNTKYEPISLSPQDAQWLDARKFNVHEMARWFGVTPQLLMESTAGVATSSSEQSSTDFVSFTLNNWTNRIASAASRSILAPEDKLVFQTSHLIQPDMRTRSSASVMWRTAQVKSINDLRAEEGLPRIADTRADDVFYVSDAQASGAAVPGANQGKPSQPVPAKQEPTVTQPTDNNLVT